LSAAAPEFAPVLAFLRRVGLVGGAHNPRAVPLTGGVSSDIWRVDLPGGPVCVKRALARLRVAQLWEVPTVRNAYERQWMETAAAIVPGSAPRILAHDDDGFFAMEYLDGERYPLWKEQLRAGHADPGFAAAVGARLALIHAGTAGRAEFAERFATDANFHAIRLEPYFVATARAHPELAAPLLALVERTAGTRLALVHGDVSPKNILAGPQGPVFLDAECAWYGDPAFDLGFCLNHLLLKCLWRPPHATRFLECFDALARAYLAGVAWEPAAEIERRAATLLPGLLLARVDGKSPVEYLVGDEAAKSRVRRAARALFAAPAATLGEVLAAWRREIAA
jgi:aminoglycoside phosphotransferase (APT) family kinase protein